MQFKKPGQVWDHFLTQEQKKPASNLEVFDASNRRKGLFNPKGLELRAQVKFSGANYTPKSFRIKKTQGRNQCTIKNGVQ